MTEELKRICEQLQSTSGRNDKESILRDNQENELFVKTLQFLLNPSIVTGISSKKIEKVINKTIEQGHEIEGDITAMYQYLIENHTGRDQDIALCKVYLLKFSAEMQKFIKCIFTKSLKLGIDAKTVNKIYGEEFIPTFECMLAEKYFEHPNVVKGKEFTITLKLDGIRCLAIKENGTVQLFSRQGQRMEGLIDIENELNAMTQDNFVLDGELLITDTASIPSKEQYKATTKIVRKDGEKHGVTYRVFDVMSSNEFRERRSLMPYNARRAQLTSLFGWLTYTKVLPSLYSGADALMITKLLKEVRADQQEGIMINLNEAFYEFKRTKNLLKCKVMSDCDLKIIGVEEGCGRLIGTLGRLNVDYKGNVLGVGSGFSDQDRKYFWENQNDMIGRVVTVQYFEETKNKDGRASLRFPVFEELRELGKEVSYS